MQAEVQKFLEATKTSKCSICGSSNYGRPGCKWSPYKETHMHLDDQTKCSWCGSKTLYGPGCPYSPTKKHGIGANFYTQMTSESFYVGMLMKRLAVPYTEMRCYELGLIDAEGNMLKRPVTEAEQLALGPLDSFIIKVKKMLGNKLELMNEQIYLEAARNVAQREQSMDEFKAEMALKSRLSSVANELFDLLSEAKQSNLPQIVIDKCVVEAFSR